MSEDYKYSSCSDKGTSKCIGCGSNKCDYYERPKGAPKAVADGIPVWCEHTRIVPIESLCEHPDNPNEHPASQLEKLAAVIRGNGWRWPIKLSSRTGLIVSGNGRFLCAKDFLKVKEVPVDVQYYPDAASELNDLLADNHIAELAEVNEQGVEAVRKKISEMGAPDLTGYADMVKAAIDGLDIKNNIDESFVAEPPAAAVTMPGDVWMLGKHRVMCGDSTNMSAYRTLTKDEPIDMLLTDPPYGVDYSGKTEFMAKLKVGYKRKAIESDKEVDIEELVKNMLTHIHWAEHNTAYIFMSNKELHNIRKAMVACDLYWSDYLCWAKQQPVFGQKDYLSQFELIAYGWHGTHKFYGKKTSGLLNYDRPKRSEEHPTMKPIELMERLISDGSAKNAVVYDPFGGSGSTLLACANLGRVCYSMELEPSYCDVIVKRYCNSYGPTDVALNRDGKTLALSETGLV